MDAPRGPGMDTWRVAPPTPRRADDGETCHLGMPATGAGCVGGVPTLPSSVGGTWWKDGGPTMVPGSEARFVSVAWISDYRNLLPRGPYYPSPSRYHIMTASGQRIPGNGRPRAVRTISRARRPPRLADCTAAQHHQSHGNRAPCHSETQGEREREARLPLPSIPAPKPSDWAVLTMLDWQAVL